MTALSPATVLAGSAHRHADTVAVVDGRARVTYAELWLEARCYGTGLRAAGVRDGDRVALLAPNVVDFPRVYFGALAAGAVAVPVGVPVAPQAVHLARDARLLVCHTSQLAAGRRLSARAGVPLLTVGPMRGPSEVPRLEDLGDVPGEPAAFAGTVAEPAHRPDLAPDSSDVVLGCLPLSGRFGQAVALTGTFRAGATLVLLSRFTGPAALDLMLREEVTVFHGTSAMYAALLDAARGRDVLPRLRRCISRAPLPPSLGQRFTTVFDTTVDVAGQEQSRTVPTPTGGASRASRQPRSRGRWCHDGQRRVHPVPVVRERSRLVADVRLRPMTADDADRVLEIYQAGLDSGNASFETVAPSWADFDAGRLAAHRLVAVDAAGTVVGWIAVSPTSTRTVYAGVVEHSVYVDPAAQGRGVARLLLDALIESTEAAGIWTIQSGVFPENTASLALHRRAGFRVIGTRERVGRHHGRWRDVVLLERRSPKLL